MKGGGDAVKCCALGGSFLIWELSYWSNDHFDLQLWRWHWMYIVNRHQTIANSGQIINVQTQISCFGQWYPKLSLVSNVPWDVWSLDITHIDWNLIMLLLVEKFTGWHLFGPTRIPACLAIWTVLCFPSLQTLTFNLLELNTSFSIMAEGSL